MKLDHISTSFSEHSAYFVAKTLAMTVRCRKRVQLVCLLAWCAVGLGLLVSCDRARGGAVGSRKMIILGIDGLDPDLLTKFMAEGEMPNFARLAQQGSFRRLTTSIPPQSPVAWSKRAPVAPVLNWMWGRIAYLSTQ